jgi:hypothetical protein
MVQLAEGFDTDTDINTSLTDARKIFESWASIGGNELPADPLDAMQVQLMRWQRAKFGDQPDERMALGVIEEVTESDTAESIDESFDALGDVAVYSSQLLTNNRLAIKPLLQLAQMYQIQLLEATATATPKTTQELAESTAAGPLMQIAKVQGQLAQVILKGAQKIRGMDDRDRYHKRLLGSLAWCLARCAATATYRVSMATPEDEKIVVTSIADVFLVIGNSVCARSEGHDAIPKLTVH